MLAVSKFSSHLITRFRRSFGFTMIEVVIIAIVVGILAAIALPSFTAMYESIKVDRAIVELRTSISQSQRAAIRGSEACESSVLVQIRESKSSFKSDFSSSCGVTSSKTIPAGVSVYSNLASTPMSEVISSQPVLIATHGNLDGLYAQASDDDDDDDDRKSSKSSKSSNKQKSWKKWTKRNCKDWGGCSSSDLRRIGFVNIEYGHHGSIDYKTQNNPTSSSGMIIAKLSNRSKGKMKCLAISRRLGLTRVGYYRGKISPKEITERGQCTTEEWNKQ